MGVNLPMHYSQYILKYQCIVLKSIHAETLRKDQRKNGQVIFIWILPGNHGLKSSVRLLQCFTKLFWEKRF